MFKVLQAACINPVHHYDLQVGTLHEGDSADFVVIEDLENFKVLQTYIRGDLVAEKSKSFTDDVDFEILNNFNTEKKRISDFEFHSAADYVRVIEALDGELVTNEIECESLLVDGNLVSNTESDVLKMAMVNRYQNEAPSIAFIKNFGLKKGAIASSVGHDSHNIIAVGVSDEMICKAVNVLIENKGGICVVSEELNEVVPLPVAGIMSDQPAEIIGQAYAKLDQFAKELGSTLGAPFMTLSFMGLLVIPSLKLSDKGLFDGSKFQFTSLEVK